MGTQSKGRWFLTVDWCNKGQRGIFCDIKGGGFSRAKPFGMGKMTEILGVFSMILAPECTEIVEQELKEYSHWYPLAEYSHQYGVACKSSIRGSN